MDQKAPRKRWQPRLRFSLLALMLVMTGLCLFLGYHVHRARVQRDAVAVLKGAGAQVLYDWEPIPDPLTPPGDGPFLPGPEWLRRLIGDE